MIDIIERSSNILKGKFMNKIAIFSLIATLAFSQAISCYAQENLILTNDSLGPINSSSIYDVKMLQQLFPDLTMKKKLHSTEGNKFEVIVAYRNNTPLFTIVANELDHKKKILCVSFNSNQIKNSLGAQIGQTYASVYQHDSKPRCMPGLEEMSGLAVCQSPQSKHIFYIFMSNKAWNGPDNRLPPLDILKQSTLKQITWMPGESSAWIDQVKCY